MTLRDLFPCLNESKPKNQPLEKVSDDEDDDDQDNVLDGKWLLVKCKIT